MKDILKISFVWFISSSSNGGNRNHNSPVLEVRDSFWCFSEFWDAVAVIRADGGRRSLRHLRHPH